jgi:hypothetical protein
MGDGLGCPSLRMTQPGQLRLLGRRSGWPAHDPQTQRGPDDRPPGHAIDHHAGAELGIGNVLQHRECGQQVPPDENVARHVGSCEAQLVGCPEQSTQSMRTGDGQLQRGARWAQLAAIPTRQAYRPAPAQTGRDQGRHSLCHVHKSLFRLTIDDQDHLTSHL